MSGYLARLKALADSPKDGTAKTAKTPEIGFTRFTQSPHKADLPECGVSATYIGSELWRKIGAFYDACKESSDADPEAWRELRPLILAYDNAAAGGEDRRAAWAEEHGQRMMELALRIEHAGRVLEGKELYEEALRVFGPPVALSLEESRPEGRG